MSDRTQATAFPNQPVDDQPPAEFVGVNDNMPVAPDAPHVGDAAPMPPGFRTGEHGLERCVLTREGDETWIPVCSPITARALVRDAASCGWALAVDVQDPDGVTHEVILPRSLIANDAAALREKPCDVGLSITATSQARRGLHDFLSASSPSRRVLQVQNIGWHKTAFVLPDIAYGVAEGTEVAFDGGSSRQHSFKQAGILQEWQAMALQLVGNSRVVLALCAAIAAPLLQLVDGESGGIHIMGASSTGKSTALFVGGSFWGGGGMRGNVKSWRTTDNAIESIARAHSDTSLMLDEIGQADARAVHAISYMLTNGQGKARGTRDGGARSATQWRLTFVSTGELSLADKLTEAGGRAMAGQAVRIVDVPLPDAGMGIFERLPEGFTSPAAFASHLQEVSKRCYGTPCRPFLQQVTENYDALAEHVRAFIDHFVAEHCPAGSDGQVQRVCERFALFAAAGELASQMGILPWAEGNATEGVEACFQAWLVNRGGIGAGEMLSAVSQVRDSLERHANKHFDLWIKNAPGGAALEARVQDRWGVRSVTKGQTEFYVTAGGFGKLCSGFDKTAVAKRLVELGMLKPGADGKSSVSVNVPGALKARYYHIVLNGTGDELEADDGR